MNLRLLLALNIDVEADDIIDAVADEIEAGRVLVKSDGDQIVGLQYTSIQHRWPTALPATVA
jgi:hypothetical protein